MTETALIATVFVTPMTITGIGRLLMLLPLAAAISIVYKAIHCERIRDIPRASLILWLTIVATMAAIGVILLLLFRLLA